MLQKKLATLYPCVTDFADLFAVELLPFGVIHFLVEGLDVGRRNKVEEGVAHVASVLDSNRPTLKSIGR